VESGASATGATVSSGGQDYIVSGGLAASATILSGGIETVFGTASGTTLSGGVQYDYGVAIGGTAVGAGAEQIVEAGAVASGMTVDSGGLEYLVSGGTVVGTTISGGTLVVTRGDTGGNVTFATGGILELDSLMAFGGTISGFHLGDEIDLRGLAFTSGTTNLSWSQFTSGANASGTLTVSSGAAVETLTLLGQYTAANFSVTSDGAGGTLITDPPASNSVQTPLFAAHHT
jgi:autotransporter passenger strand-loop-strand repeat protein